MAKVTVQHQINDYCQYYGDVPFTIEKICESLGLRYTQVQPHVNRLEKIGIIKKSCFQKKRFWVKNVKSESDKQEYDFTPKIDIINLIEPHKDKPIREISSIVGVSQSTVDRYLKVIKHGYVEGWQFKDYPNQLPKVDYRKKVGKNLIKVIRKIRVQKKKEK